MPYVLNDTVEGESIETKIERVVNNNEPIKDGAPLIYTPRSEGVNPAYDIRTDRFDVALGATDMIAKSHTARRDNVPEMKAEKGGKEDGGTESIEGGKEGKTGDKGA